MNESKTGPEAGGPEADIDLFIYHVTHDVRAGLRAMKVLPAWIREDLENAGITLPDETREKFDLLERRAAQTDRLVADLARYARARKAVDPPSAFSLDETLNDAVREASVPDTFAVERQECEITLTASRGAIRAILAVFLQNAVRHNDRGSGVIQVTTFREHGRVRIQVADGGPGIPAQHRGKIFDLFYTVERPDTRQRNGIGLPLAKKLADALHGCVRIVPNGAERGATFQLDFPERPG